MPSWRVGGPPPHKLLRSHSPTSEKFGQHFSDIRGNFSKARTNFSEVWTNLSEVWPRHSGRRFEPFAKGSGSVQVQAECNRTFFKRFSREQVRFFGNAQSIVKRGMCNLPPAGAKLHRLFHSSMPEFSGTPNPS